MTEDSSIPERLAALADALQMVCANINLSRFGFSILRGLHATGPDSKPRDHEREDERKKVLDTAVESAEAVDTAERILSTIPVEVFKPLGTSEGGERWDVRTRRTLKEFQASLSILHGSSTKPNFVSMLVLRDEAGFDEMQSKLARFSGELDKRIFDLQCLSDADSTDPKDAPLKPIDKAKVERNDWLLEMRGMDHRPKMTEAELSDALLKECENRPDWVPIEPKSIPAALRKAYKRQTGNPWPFDGRGRTKKTGK
jgi:hypothetical protein